MPAAKSASASSRGQPREPRAVAAGEPVAARRAAHRLDRDARGREGLDVAVDRPHRDLEPLRDLRRRELSPRLEQEEERDKPCGPHFLKMTEDGLFVCQSLGMNIWDDEWGEQDEDWSGGGGLRSASSAAGRCSARASTSSSRGNFMIFHFHHGSEELLLVLRGRPTLRTLAGERQLDEGDVVHFPTGADGSHESRNDTDEPVRYVVAGTRVSPEVVEYPDLNQLTAQSRHAGLFVIHDVKEEA